jgi:hypothetical protein
MTEPVVRVERLVGRLGGRFSVELGLDLDHDVDGREVDGWFLAATLFGPKVPWVVAEVTYRSFVASGVRGLSDVPGRDAAEIEDLLAEGSYVRFDPEMAQRLPRLAAAVMERQGSVAAMASIGGAVELRGELARLPGWSSSQADGFLRDLRGLWPGAAGPVDVRATTAGRHLELLPDGPSPPPLESLGAVAAPADTDVRDLECALVRLDLGHGRRFPVCPGGVRCEVLR